MVSPFITHATARVHIDWGMFLASQFAVYLIFWLLFWWVIRPKPAQTRIGWPFQIIIGLYVLIELTFSDMFFGGIGSVAKLLILMASGTVGAIPVWKLFPRRAKQI